MPVGHSRRHVMFSHTVSAIHGSVARGRRGGPEPDRTPPGPGYGAMPTPSIRLHAASWAAVMAGQESPPGRGATREA